MKFRNNAIEAGQAANTAMDGSDLDETAALLLEAFPTPEDIISWIEDAIAVIQGSNKQWKCKDAALEIVWPITSLLLSPTIDVKTNGKKVKLAKEYIEYMVRDFAKGRDGYIKTVEMLKDGYMNIFGMDGLPVMVARHKIYQFEALKEIGKMMQE